MANPRQRRKAKSSSHKAISHSKRAKRLQRKMPGKLNDGNIAAIRGPKALQDAWDPSKTLRQNYVALGLEHDLNPISSGGSEVNLSRTIDTSQLDPTASSSTIDGAQPSASEGATATSALPKGFGRIIRDSSGEVVRVELPSDEEAGQGSEREPMIGPPVVTTKSELGIWAQQCTDAWKRAGPESVENTIVQDLENLAAFATARERHTSFGERSYLERLVSKYGDDLPKMARDRRLNPQQRTTNELRRAIAKAGGYEALCGDTVTEVTG